MAQTEDEKPILVVKKIKKGGDGHHGGAWKVAYADFVTAMMAFFLLMWLLNVSTDEQLNAISNYFDPTVKRVSSRESGAGGVLGGMAVSHDGSMTTNQQSLTSPETGFSGQSDPSEQTPNEETMDQSGQAQDLKSAEETAIEEELARREKAEFEKIEEALKQAIQSSPELKEMMKNLLIDQTPEGLRIQIVDQEGESMFPLGSAKMYEKTKKLHAVIADVIKAVDNKVSIRGHTDGKPYGKNARYNNWDLSADRANASRRALIDAKLEATRIYNVVGKADKDHLIKDDPLSPQNRRISIILLKDALVKQQSALRDDDDTQQQQPQQTAPTRKTPPQETFLPEGLESVPVPEDTDPNALPLLDFP